MLTQTMKIEVIDDVRTVCVARDPDDLRVVQVYIALDGGGVFRTRLLVGRPYVLQGVGAVLLADRVRLRVPPVRGRA